AAGIVGCRIIDSPRERLLAILTNNFVPCNGRLPQPHKGKENYLETLSQRKKVKQSILINQKENIVEIKKISPKS
ncbi:MAG: hypothetical protein PHG19_07175, partial [Anaerotignum sp.]|nr:hypothetical protein [Anaerotignum sp.]